MTAAVGRADQRGMFQRALDRDMVLVATSSWSRVRAFAALLVAVGFGLLVAMLLRDHDLADWRPSGRLAWSLSLLAAVMLVARGIYLGRPVTNRHAAAALVMLLVGMAGHLVGRGVVGDLLIAASGLALMWPLQSQPDAAEEVWPLIQATPGDPLAPFAMHWAKSYFFNTDRSAALAYRTRLGFAVVSADPVGAPDAYGALIEGFAAMCRRRGWRIIVLNCSEGCLSLWRDAAVVARPVMAVPVGRDVVVDVQRFTLSGRKFRNLRQAVSRTRNRGITTEVVAERDLTQALKAELTEVMQASHGRGDERGFSMMLDGTLSGRYPGVVLIVGRDRDGRVQAFNRYVCAGGGTDVSLDLPWRRPGAPNGIDERLTMDMIEWCREHGAQRLSLAFAAFPELFDERHHTAVQRIYYQLIRLGDPLIGLESLYRYVRKFRALGGRRYVLLSARHLLVALVLLLALEFLPHRPR